MRHTARQGTVHQQHGVHRPATASRHGSVWHPRPTPLTTPSSATTRPRSCAMPTGSPMTGWQQVRSLTAGWILRATTAMSFTSQRSRSCTSGSRLHAAPPSPLPDPCTTRGGRTPGTTRDRARLTPGHTNTPALSINKHTNAFGNAFMNARNDARPCAFTNDTDQRSSTRYARVIDEHGSTLTSIDTTRRDAPAIDPRRTTATATTL